MSRVTARYTSGRGAFPKRVRNALDVLPSPYQRWVPGPSMMHTKPGIPSSDVMNLVMRYDDSAFWATIGLSVGSLRKQFNNYGFSTSVFADSSALIAHIPAGEVQFMPTGAPAAFMSLAPPAIIPAKRKPGRPKKIHAPSPTTGVVDPIKRKPRRPRKSHPAAVPAASVAATAVSQTAIGGVTKAKTPRSADVCAARLLREARCQAEVDATAPEETVVVVGSHFIPQLHCFEVPLHFTLFTFPRPALAKKHHLRRRTTASVSFPSSQTLCDDPAPLQSGRRVGFEDVHLVPRDHRGLTSATRVFGPDVIEMWASARDRAANGCVSGAPDWPMPSLESLFAC
jgi:hypothetical protein